MFLVAIQFLDNDNINDYFSIDVIDEFANNLHIDMCPNDSLELVIVNFVSTLDEIHYTHFGTYLHVEESLSVEIHGLID